MVVVHDDRLALALISLQLLSNHSYPAQILSAITQT